MKRYFTILLSLLSLSLYSQNFRLNSGGSYALFTSVNDRQVPFYGFGINYTYYFYKRLGFNIGYDHFLPSTYYGQVKYMDFEYSTAPAYITGDGNSFGFGLKMKIVDPASKKIEISATIARSYFIHKGAYNKEPFIRHYAGWSIPEIKNKVHSVYLGAEVIFKLGNLPLFFSCGYNQVLGQKTPYDEWDGYSVPFSSSLVIRAGISLPLMRGPVPSEIKKIEY